LELLVMDREGRLGAALVVPVAAGGARLRIVAGGQPLLSQVPEPMVVGRIGAAHLRRHPAGVHRVAEHVRPDARDGDGERRDEELAVRIRAGRAVAAPVHPGQAGSTAAVHAAAEVDQALRAVDERSQQVWGDHVDGQDMRPADDAGVVDHRVHRPDAVHLVGDVACLVEVGQVSDDGLGAAVQQVAHGREAIRAASVDDDFVAVLDQRLRGRPSEAVGGAGDEDACHELAGWFAAWCGQGGRSRARREPRSGRAAR
jgi:hypothetical protein